MAGGEAFYCVMNRGGVCTTIFLAFVQSMKSDIDIHLEELGESHCRQTFAWVSHPYIQKQFSISSPPTWETHQEYFPQMLQGDRKSFAVIYQGQHVGNCGLKSIVPQDSAELWIYIGELGLYGKGIGTGATRQLIRFAFEEIKLKRLFLHVDKTNVPARALYAKMGFAAVESLDARWQGRGNILQMVLERKSV